MLSHFFMYCFKAIKLFLIMLRKFHRKMKPSLAYCQTTGSNSPGVVFLSGFNSSMTGQKAVAIEQWCK